MPKPPFDEIWKRIKVRQGQTFQTITGLPFTYKIIGNTLYSSRTKYQISRSEFKKAFELPPFLGPGDIRNIIRGPSYVWAIFNDKRISHGQW